MFEPATIFRTTLSLCPQCGAEATSAVANGNSPADLRDPAGVIAVQVDNAGIRVATGAVILLAAIAIILWAAAILQTGLDLKQILAILKAFFDAVKDAQGSTDGGAEAGGTPSPGRGTT